MSGIQLSGRLLSLPISKPVDEVGLRAGDRLVEQRREFWQLQHQLADPPEALLLLRGPGHHRRVARVLGVDAVDPPRDLAGNQKSCGSPVVGWGGV